MNEPLENKSGIVLAMFGTSVESGLSGFLNIRDKMVERFPGTPVRMAFTSSIIRNIWQKRAKDPSYSQDHPEVPEDILHIGEPLSAITDLQQGGHNSIVVQPVHIAPADEFLDLMAYVEDMNGVHTQAGPFTRLVIGRPALGSFGSQHHYTRDIKEVVQAVAEDVEQARDENAALVYMGHGNQYYPSSGVYLEFAAEMNRVYPDILTAIITLKGVPTLHDAVARLKEYNVKKVLLKPFMVVAGNHARRDMIGDSPESLLKRLEAEGFLVHPVMSGLGEQDAFARVFVQHAEDAASAAGIELK